MKKIKVIGMVIGLPILGITLFLAGMFIAYFGFIIFGWITGIKYY